MSSLPLTQQDSITRADARCHSNKRPDSSADHLAKHKPKEYRSRSFDTFPNPPYLTRIYFIIQPIKIEGHSLNEAQELSIVYPIGCSGHHTKILLSHINSPMKRLPPTIKPVFVQSVPVSALTSTEVSHRMSPAPPVYGARCA